MLSLRFLLGLLCLALVAVSLPATSLVSAAPTAIELNRRGLDAAQASPPNHGSAFTLFQAAYLAARAELRKQRRELTKLLKLEEAQDRAAHGGLALTGAAAEADPEDTFKRILALRTSVISARGEVVQYLNNLAVTEMRRGRLTESRAILYGARKILPNNADIERNIVEVEGILRKNGNGRLEKFEDASEDDENEAAGEEEDAPADDEAPAEDADDGPPRKRRPLPTPTGSHQHKPSNKRLLTALDRKRRPNTNPREKFPRIHISHLQLPENEQYRRGLAPFVLLGALDGWNLTRDWSTTGFARDFGHVSSDFYPQNMDWADVRPFLTPLREALEEQSNPSGKFPASENYPGSYIQWNVHHEDWMRLVKNMLPTAASGGYEFPDIFKQDDPWLAEPQEQCLHSEALIDQFTRRTHWRMVIIGNRGAGMFNHQDVLRTASWQAQVAGAKRWHICAPSESRWLYGAGKIDTFDPDYLTYPLFANARCYDDVVETGEMVFYPADYWHQTENVATPTISVTATVMDRNNYHMIADELTQECLTGKYKWGFDAELCSALRDKCFKFWEKIYRAQDGPPTTESVRELLRREKDEL